LSNNCILIEYWNFCFNEFVCALKTALILSMRRFDSSTSSTWWFILVQYKDCKKS